MILKIIFPSPLIYFPEFILYAWMVSHELWQVYGPTKLGFQCPENKPHFVLLSCGLLNCGLSSRGLLSCGLPCSIC